MGIALAVHGLLVGLARWPEAGGNASAQALNATNMLIGIVTALIVMLAVRRGHRNAYGAALGLLTLPLLAFAANVVQFGQVGIRGVLMTLSPALIALVAMGCLNHLSTRSWMILRRGEIANAAHPDIDVTHLGSFRTGDGGAKVMELKADAETISIADTQFSQTKAVAYILAIPRSNQMKLVLALRHVLKPETVPTENFDEALAEALKAAINERGLTLTDIQTLGIKHGFAFALKRYESGTRRTSPPQTNPQTPTIH